MKNKERLLIKKRLPVFDSIKSPKQPQETDLSISKVAINENVKKTKDEARDATKKKLFQNNRTIPSRISKKEKRIIRILLKSCLRKTREERNDEAWDGERSLRSPLIARVKQIIMRAIKTSLKVNKIPP